MEGGAGEGAEDTEAGVRDDEGEEVAFGDGPDYVGDFEEEGEGVVSVLEGGDCLFGFLVGVFFGCGLSDRGLGSGGGGGGHGRGSAGGKSWVH